MDIFASALNEELGSISLTGIVRGITSTSNRLCDPLWMHSNHFAGVGIKFPVYFHLYIYRRCWLRVHNALGMWRWANGMWHVSSTLAALYLTTRTHSYLSAFCVCTICKICWDDLYEFVKNFRWFIEPNMMIFF